MKAFILIDIAFVHACHHVFDLDVSFVQVYRDGIYKLSCNCASEAEKHGAQRYIEVSSAQMYSTDKV